MSESEAAAQAGLPVIRQLVVDWLLSRGVPPLALGFPSCLFQYNDSIVAVKVTAWGGDPVDLALWEPRTGDLWSANGKAFALGEDNILNPGSYCFDLGLAVHKTPLDWLKAGRDGICIIRPEWAAHRLRQVPRLTVDDANYGRKLERQLIGSLPQIGVQRVRAAS